jgi:hypothetical protein
VNKKVILTGILASVIIMSHDGQQQKLVGAPHNLFLSKFDSMI